MSEHKDPLDSYLRGESEISRLYREERAEEPPKELDDRILRAARQELRGPAARWTLPLSAAATVLLAFGTLLQMQEEGVTPVPAEATAPIPAVPPANPAARAFTSDSAPAARVVEPEAKRSNPREEAPQRYSTEAAGIAHGKSSPAPAPAMQDEAIQEHEAATPAAASAPELESRHERQASSLGKPEKESGAEEWLEKIRQLYAEGRDEEARTELEALREVFPDYPIPEDLQSKQP